MLAKRIAARYLEARLFQGKVLTKIWVVRDPGPDSELADILYETTPKDIVNYAIGTGSSRWALENTTFHDSESSAKADAEKRMALRDAAQAKKGLYPVYDRRGRLVWVTVPEREEHA